MGLAQDAWNGSRRNFMQEHRRNHEIETGVWIVERFGVHLLETQFETTGRGAGCCITQTRSRNVDADDFGLAEDLTPGGRVVPCRTAQIENPPWSKLRIFERNEAGDGLPDVIELGTEHAEGGQRQTIFIDGAHGRIVFAVFLDVTSGHQMYVEGAHRARHLEALFQDQCRRCARVRCKIAYRRCKIRSLTLDGRTDDLIKQILRGHP